MILKNIFKKERLVRALSAGLCFSLLEFFANNIVSELIEGWFISVYFFLINTFIIGLLYLLINALLTIILKNRKNSGDTPKNLFRDIIKVNILVILAYLVLNCVLNIVYEGYNIISIKLMIVCILLNITILPSILVFCYKVSNYPRGKKIKTLLVLFMISITGFFLTSYYHPIKADDSKPNIVFILSDTTRADRLSVYNNEVDTTPNLKEFSEVSITFKKAYSTIGSTRESMSSIMTGLYPQNNGVRGLGYNLDSKHYTLAEILRDNGYKTAIFSRNSILGSSKIGPSSMLQGVEEIDWGPYINDLILTTIIYRSRISDSLFKAGLIRQQNNAEECTNRVVHWLKKNKDNRFFIWIHYMDPHWKYIPPETYREKYSTGFKGDFVVNNGIKYPGLIFNKVKSEPQVPEALALYDALTNYIDDQVGIVIDTLRELDLYDNTIIVFTSDHGEAFGEHGVYFSHHIYTYDEELSVPLIMKMPGNEYSGSEVNDPVSLVQFMPTILDTIGIDYSKRQFDGETLHTLLDKKKQDNIVFAESYRVNHVDKERKYYQGIKGQWRMIVAQPWKLILIPHPDGDILELYNLEKDPKEKMDLSDERKDIAIKLEKRLRQWIDMDPNKDDTSKMNITPEHERILRQLGYIQ